MEDINNLTTSLFARQDKRSENCCLWNGEGLAQHKVWAKSPAAPRTASYLNYWGLVYNKVREFAVPLQGFMGRGQEISTSTPIPMFLRGLNNSKLNVNQTLLG